MVYLSLCSRTTWTEGKVVSWLPSLVLNLSSLKRWGRNSQTLSPYEGWAQTANSMMWITAKRKEVSPLSSDSSDQDGFGQSSCTKRQMYWEVLMLVAAHPNITERKCLMIAMAFIEILNGFLSTFTLQISARISLNSGTYDSCPGY